MSERKIMRQLTIRRMLNGKLAVFVGDDEIDGIVGATVVDNPESYGVYLHVDTASVYFDTEKLSLDMVN